jgi:hypothetical protein
MTRPPQPTERFAQHSRLAELITALGFRRYRAGPGTGRKVGTARLMSAEGSALCEG